MKTNNISKTAKELNINLRTLHRKLKNYSIKKMIMFWAIQK
jgi:ActR/RegA family two-component response regulator